MGHNLLCCPTPVQTPPAVTINTVLQQQALSTLWHNFSATMCIVLTLRSTTFAISVSSFLLQLKLQTRGHRTESEMTREKLHFFVSSSNFIQFQFISCCILSRNIGVARILSRGALFFLKKVEYLFFLVVTIKTQAKTAKLTTHDSKI